MKFAVVCSVFCLTQVVKCLPTIEKEKSVKQSNLAVNELKYYKLDTKYLLEAVTQNKSVKPCEDFKEFSLGNLMKSRAASDRNAPISFKLDIDRAYRLKLQKVLAAKVDKIDTRITRAMKKMYAECVDADYIKRSGVEEMRVYLKSFGLNFYPETNQEDFSLSNYFEQQPAHAMRLLLQVDLSRDFYDDLALKQTAIYSPKLYFSSYEDLLHEMFHENISRNADKFKKDFHEIAQRQKEFYDHQQSFTSNEYDDNVFMSFSELNNLTSKLNLDWTTIVNNQLITQIELDVKINVANSRAVAKLSEFIASADKKAIADYLAYDLIFSNAEFVEVYKNDRWIKQVKGTSANPERWSECVAIFSRNMAPALMYLLLSRDDAKMQQKSLLTFMEEAEQFAYKRIKNEVSLGEKIVEALIDSRKTLKTIVGYPEEFLNPQKVEELYSHLLLGDDQSLIESASEIQLYHQKILLESSESAIRNFIKYTADEYDHNIKYYALEDAIFIPARYLIYPAYHNQRPRFFNSASVGNYFFDSFKWRLAHILSDKFDCYGYELLDGGIQIAYEFYDDWLKSGGEDKQIVTNRFDSRQLYWIAAARIYYQKTEKTEMPPPNQEDDIFQRIHDYFILLPGFREAFQCNLTDVNEE